MFCVFVYSFRSGVEVLFNELEVPMEEYSFGRSKIFIRNPRTVCNLYALNSNPIACRLIPEVPPWRPYLLVCLKGPRAGAGKGRYVIIQHQSHVTDCTELKE